MKLGGGRLTRETGLCSFLSGAVRLVPSLSPLGMRSHTQHFLVYQMCPPVPSGIGQSDSVRYGGSHSPPGTKGTHVLPIKRSRQSAGQVGGNPAWTI